MFIPPDVAISTIDGSIFPDHYQLLRPRFTQDLTETNAAAMHMFRLHAGMQAQGFVGEGNNCQQCVHYKTVVNRNVGRYAKFSGTASMNPDASPVYGFPVTHESDHVPRDAHFQYTMKALYEFGNSQDEFGQDGLPTKVLPNLIPVDRSPNIPNLV